MPSSGTNFVTFKTSLCGSYALLAIIFTHVMHFIHVFKIYAVLCVHSTDLTLKEDGPVNELSTLTDFVGVFELKLEHLCIVLKSCLAFELEYIVLKCRQTSLA